MKYPVRKFLEKVHRLNKLVDKVTRIEIKAKMRVIIQRIKRPSCRINIISDFGWMYLKCKTNTFFFINIEDRQPTISKISITSIDILQRCGRKEIKLGPYATASRAN